MDFTVKPFQEEPKFTREEKNILAQYDNEVRFLNAQRQRLKDDEKLLGVTPETPWISERQYRPREADMV